MGDSFELLFWLAVFLFFALRGATRKRTGSSLPDSDEAGGSTSDGRRRGILGGLVRQIEEQMEAQRREAERRASGGEPPTQDPTGPAEARRRRVEAVEARAHPAERRPGERWAPTDAERPVATRAPDAGRRWEPPTEPDEERPLPPEVRPERTYVVPGRRIHAPGTVSVGRSPETARALDQGARTTAIGRGGEDVRVEEVGARGRGGLVRLERYPAPRRAILLAELLGPPPGLTGRPSVDRRLEEIA